MLKSILRAVAVFGLVGIASTTNAVVVDFEEMNTGAFYGKTNVDASTLYLGAVPVNCVGTFNCYAEGGFLFGTLFETNNPLAHVHQYLGASTALEYHADSAGIYVRRADLGSFSLNSLDVLAISGYQGANFKIVGFSSAYSPTIAGDTAPFNNQVATATLTQTGTIDFGSGFSNIRAFWIYYNNTTSTPVGSGISWDIIVDNIRLNEVAAVPLPAAAWLFGSSLLGVGALARRRRGGGGPTATSCA